MRDRRDRSSQTIHDVVTRSKLISFSQVTHSFGAFQYLITGERKVSRCLMMHNFNDFQIEIFTAPSFLITSPPPLFLIFFPSISNVVVASGQSILAMRHDNVNGLVQDCCNSIANALEFLQSCTKLSMSTSYDWWIAEVCQQICMSWYNNSLGTVGDREICIHTSSFNFCFYFPFHFRTTVSRVNMVVADGPVHVQCCVTLVTTKMEVANGLMFLFVTLFVFAPGHLHQS